MSGDPSPSIDLGFTHVALPVRDLEASLDFYERFASMRVVHRRADPDTGLGVAWIGDLTRPFVVVLIEVAEPEVHGGLTGFAHLGVGVTERGEIDRLVAMARAEGRPVMGPRDSGYPVGYWAFVTDPDGHNLELSHGQEVGLAVERHARGRVEPPPPGR